MFWALILGGRTPKFLIHFLKIHSLPNMWESLLAISGGNSEITRWKTTKKERNDKAKHNGLHCRCPYHRKGGYSNGSFLITTELKFTKRILIYSSLVQIQHALLSCTAVYVWILLRYHTGAIISKLRIQKASYLARNTGVHAVRSQTFGTGI